MNKITIILLVVALWPFGVVWYLEYQEQQNDMAYVEMCQTMGGVAVLGKRGTNQCFNVEAVLAAE